MSVWPDDRPVDYDPEMGYDETNQEWTDSVELIQKSGGKNKQYIVAVGNLKIYYGILG